MPVNAPESGLMRRPRIDALLEKAFTKPLVTVTAGAGCGKTSAVYSYLQSSSLRPVWVQLSEADNLPARFWDNFANAVGQHNPALGENIRRQEMPANKADLYRFAGLLADEIKPHYRYALVFDDLHLIHESAVLWFIRALANGIWSSSLAAARPGNTIVLISREDCGFDGEKLAAMGHMAQVAAEDLNFTKSETADLFRFFGVAATPALLSGISEIYADTEGWAFLTSLAGRLLQKRPGGMKYLREALRHNVSLLIENELLLENTPGMNKFLAKLSLIDHLAAGLVSMLENGDALIKELLDSTSLVRYDAYMDVYYVHHLLQDFLLQKQQLLSGGEKREVCLTAAAWCLEHDYKMDAAGYYAQAGEYQGVIDIVYMYPQFLPMDAAALLFDILDGAPPGLEKEMVSLHSYRGRLLLSLGRIDQAVEEMRAVIQELEPLGGEGDSPDNRRRLMGAYYVLGHAHMLACSGTGVYDFAEYFEKAEEYGRGSGFAPRGSMRVATVAPYILRIGKSGKGEPEDYTEALTRAVPHVSRLMDGCMAGLDDLARAELSYYRADVAGCKRYAMQALYKAQEKGQYEIENRALFFLMRVGLAAGKYPAVKDAMRRMDAQMDTPGFINRYIRYDIQTGWFYGSIGQKELVADWLKSDFAVSRSQTVIANYEDFARAKYYLEEQQYHALLAMLSCRTGGFDVGRYLFGQIGVAAHRAVCLYNLKDHAGAFEALRQAYELAAPNGLHMIFIELGNHMRTLAAAAQKAGGCGVPEAWLEEVQKKAATYAKRIGQVRSQYRQAEGLDGSVQLTQKEVNLLQDLSHGLSRTESAAARGISINTVKMMLQYVYEKLGAENSMDAVRIAFAKGIL
ncbi:MAG: LuxR C-terminal-related transcriptional regulator [Oscillospiraceae bacterium]|jgi:LuxR family maltose regulon positive regulatory protein|nr:LuxR C-terminal-related transcriptional regulator [Oscillospiraceae bacterium]